MSAGERQGGGQEIDGQQLTFYNLFTKSTDKIHCRYEAPREEPREAHGCLTVSWKSLRGCIISLCW
jgi:hypothetical protein